MANKNFWLGMLIMTLLFGTIGCDTGTNGDAGEPAGITYTVEADGTLDKETSTQLNFTFSEAVDSLRLGDITIFASTGKAAVNTSIKNYLKGGGTEWTLSIKQVTQGKIRVQITKDGVYRGRMTLLVHQNTASASTKDDAITLSASQWEDGSLAAGEAKWYKFEAAAGKNYRVQWKNYYYQPAGEDYTGAVKATAYQNDGTTVISDWGTDSNGYYYPRPLSMVSGTVYLKVELFRDDVPGSYAVRFYDQASMPQVVLRFHSTHSGKVKATVVPSVAVKWNVNPLTYTAGEDVAAKATVSGFRVHRSDTETGEYEQIGEDFIFTGFKVTGAPSSDADRVIYCDKDVIVGKAYWYKVTAYNSTGETEMSDPIQSEAVPDPASVPLTMGVQAEGRLTEETDTAAAWYTFEATSGKTYRVQWNSNENSEAGNWTTKYGRIKVSAFTADKELVNLKTDYNNGAENGWSTPGTISGVSGTVYLRVNLIYITNPNGPGSYFTGPYTIKVSEQ
jgi:hypothetical protein